MPALPTSTGRIRTTKRYGWRPDLPDHRDLWLAPPASGTLPPKVDQRGPLMPPIYDQGQVGSCTGNATAGLVQYTRRRGNLEPDYPPSRLFIYYNARVLDGDPGQDGGAELRSAVKSVAQSGAPPEVDWPYVPAMVTDTPPQDAYTAGATDRAIKYQRIVQALFNLRHCLALGLPFVFGFTVYESFESDQVAQTGVVPMPSLNEQVLGGHAVMACGYDDSQKRFLIRNSWGTSWGMAGYCTMPYAYLVDRGLASDFWTIQRISG